MSSAAQQLSMMEQNSRKHTQAHIQAHTQEYTQEYTSHFNNSISHIKRSDIVAVDRL